MAVIKKNEIIAPFLSTKLNFIPGQDPMGLLNVGEQAFAMLLPGLNGVTSRIRYYSFYCWFFGWYAENIGSENPKEQRRYLRRAEYLLALIGARNNTLVEVKEERAGVSGITEAEKNYSSDLSEFSLLEGTGESENKTEGTYWKNPRGIFGQNYVSSMRQIGLVRDKGEDSGLFIRTAFIKDDIVTGKDLQNAFEDNLSQNSSSLFKQVLIAGTITHEELILICDDFNMMKVPPDSKENDLLLKMLISTDYPTTDTEQYFRRNTIRLYLDSFKESKQGVSVQDFVNNAYKTQGKIYNEPNETLMGWYYFQLSQFWHIVSTSALAQLLRSLGHKGDSGWFVESILIEEIANEVINVFKEIANISTGGSFEDLIVLEMDNLDITSKTHSHEYPLGFAYSFLLLRKLIAENESMIKDISNYAQTHKLGSSSDFVNVYSDLVIKSKLSLTEFIKYFLRRYVLNRHQIVALYKMNDTQSTEKFLREDGYIRLIEFIQFGFSSPRLGSIISFMKDLNVLTRNGNTLTEFGYIFHKSLKA